MGPGKERALDRFQPTADLVRHFSCRTVETCRSQVVTQRAQNRVCQRSSVEALPAFDPAQTRVSLGRDQFAKVVEAAIVAGGPD